MKTDIPSLSFELQGEHLKKCDRCGEYYNWLVSSDCYKCDTLDIDPSIKEINDLIYETLKIPKEDIAKMYVNVRYMNLRQTELIKKLTLDIKILKMNTR